MTNTYIRAYHSTSDDYRKAFDCFLAHTDQKTVMRSRLDKVVGELPRRDVFVDGGAGNGAVTTWYAGDFAKTIAVEPNASLRAELARQCPQATVIDGTITSAAIEPVADLVLCSHVFYYIPSDAWLENLERMVSWLAPGGVLVCALQNHGTDCMRMLDYFYGRHYNLSKLTDQFRRGAGSRYNVRLETLPATINTDTLEDAYTIAEFMLNLVDLENDPQKPTRAGLEEYVRRYFQNVAGRFSFTCDQDFLMIRS